MDLNLIAVIVGIVEGLTEFLPVSSTGHMIIVGHVLGFEGQLADVFDVFVQLGAILSVVFIYKERFARFFTKDGWDINKGLSVWHVAAGIVPVMLVAFFLYHYIKEYLFSPFTVAIGLFLGGLLLMFAEYRTKGREAELVDDVDKISSIPCKNNGSDVSVAKSFARVNDGVTITPNKPKIDKNLRINSLPVPNINFAPRYPGAY